MIPVPLGVRVGVDGTKGRMTRRDDGNEGLLSLYLPSLETDGQGRIRRPSQPRCREVAAGTSRREAAQRYRVSASSAVRWRSSTRRPGA